MSTANFDIRDLGTTDMQLGNRSAAAIRVHDLWKRYGSIEAVRGINLEVGQGEIFGLIGPDGAGKTSTFQILAGVMEAHQRYRGGLWTPRSRNAVADRLSDAGVQPLSRPERHRKHPLHRRSAPRSGRARFWNADTAIYRCSTWIASRTGSPDG